VAYFIRLNNKDMKVRKCKAIQSTQEPRCREIKKTLFNPILSTNARFEILQMDESGNITDLKGNKVTLKRVKT
jgi:hypothetical protein